MYRNLIKYHLIQNKLVNIIVLILTSVIITLKELSILKLPNTEGFVLGHIFLLVFGGIKIHNNLMVTLIEFSKWIFPHVIVFYYIYLSVNNELKDRMILLLPRIGNKTTWFLAYNLGLIIEIIKQYLIIFTSSLVVITVVMGKRAYNSSYMDVNNFNNLLESTNQYKIIVIIVILSILMMISIISFINNILLIFKNNSTITLGTLLICIFPLFIRNKSSVLVKLNILNNGMIISHNMFSNGLTNFSISFSLIYMILFIVLNILLGIYLIKKSDLYNINNIFG